jgi:ubiquinone biosynthesis UbiH/UbiF/VisC/COQ6 family hydroxylase
MSADRFDVAVVGAGLAGAAAALGCAQLGLRTALIGRAPARHAPTEPAPFDVRIYALAPASIALAERLHVWGAVDAARTQRVERMRIFGDEGRELDFDAYGAAVERLATIVEENELARVLHAACGFTPSLTRHAAALAAVRFEADRAALELADGTRLDAALVIAADGARSGVRAAAGISADDMSYRQTAIVANFACALGHLATAMQWFTDEGVVALLPLPPSAAAEHAVSLVWSAPDALAVELAALTPEKLAQRVDQRTDSLLGGLRPLGPCASFPLRRLTVDRLAAARVVLVGDAAHVVHPLAGQGLNLGLQDVAALLEVLAAREPFRDIGDLSLLRRYARARAEAVVLMRTTTDGLARLFATDDPLVKRVRNLGLAFVNQVPPLKRALVRRALG